MEQPPRLHADKLKVHIDPAGGRGALALLHEFLDHGLPPLAPPLRSDAARWVGTWLAAHGEHARAGGDASSFCVDAFFRSPAASPPEPLRPYVLRLFVRWMARRDVSYARAADHLTAALGAYCDGRRFFPPPSALPSSAPRLLPPGIPCALGKSQVS